jgi:TP53 regulating kinase-like protein
MTTTSNLPPPFNNPRSTSSTSLPQLPPRPSLDLITQGAEALIYRTTFLTADQPCALKFRPKKSYRHPTLDARLTKARILAEARVLVRCRKEGVLVPGVLGLDWDEGWLATEWIEGWTVRSCLDEWLRRIEAEGGIGEEVTGQAEKELEGLMEKVGRAVGKLHEIGIVHGHLTTSNLMLRPPRKTEPPEERRGGDMGALLQAEVVLIDFGLAVQTVHDEDRAVDLYVLERAFGSTHPQAEGLFKEVLKVYGQSYKGAQFVLKRLEDVRLRGRKKNMIG